MLEDVLGIRCVVLACGTVDLRKGIDGLSWPRTTQEAAELTEEQFRYLMMGLNPLDPRIKDVSPNLENPIFPNPEMGCCKAWDYGRMTELFSGRGVGCPVWRREL